MYLISLELLCDTMDIGWVALSVGWLVGALVRWLVGLWVGGLVWSVGKLDGQLLC